MEAGEIVRWYPLPKGDDEEKDVMLVGKVMVIHTGGVAEVKEAHAFHRIWGGSSGGRGDQHQIAVENLERETTYRSLVSRVLP